MQLYQDTIQDRNGNVISSAVVTITDYPGGATSTVYAADVVGANINPITADSDGQYEFYAVPGAYTLTVTKSGVTTESKVVTLGAAATSFLQSGTGAVSRTVQAKLRDICINAADFGLGDGTTTDTAAMLAAVARAKILATTGNSRGVVIRVNPGLYTFTAPIVIDFDRCTIEGAGTFLTYFQRATNYGNTFVFAKSPLAVLEHAEIIGCSFIQQTVAMTNAHILMAGVTHGRIREVTVAYGAYGILLYGGVDIVIENCSLVGSASAATVVDNSIAGVLMTDLSVYGASSGVTLLPTQITIKDSEIFGALNNGWTHGVLINAAEQVNISNCYVGNAKQFNLFIQQTASNFAILEVSVTNGTYIDGAGTDSVRITGAAGNGTSYIGGTFFGDCTIKGQAGQTSNGITVDGTARGGSYSQACRNMRVADCTISGFDAHGLKLSGGMGTTVEGCTIAGNNYNNTASASGILLGATSERTKISNNKIGDTYAGGTTSLQLYGVDVLAGATGFTIEGNDLRYNTTAPLRDSTTNAYATGKTIKSNKGYGNIAAISPTMATSTVDYNNPYGMDCIVSIFSGTVTDIKLNGQTITSATGIVIPKVGVDDVLNLTFSVAPSWVWWRQQ